MDGAVASVDHTCFTHSLIADTHVPSVHITKPPAGAAEFDEVGADTDPAVAANLKRQVPRRVVIPRSRVLRSIHPPNHGRPAILVSDREMIGIKFTNTP
jgi:hypothetical protein